MFQIVVLMYLSRQQSSVRFLLQKMSCKLPCFFLLFFLAPASHRYVSNPTLREINLSDGVGEAAYSMQNEAARHTR